jgi:hypothetical protein
MSASDPGSWGKLISAILWPGVVITAIVMFRAEWADLIKRVQKFSGPGKTEFTFQSVVATTAARLEGDADRTQRLYSDWASFVDTNPWLDDAKVFARLEEWARANRVPNYSDMGIKNFQRFLYDAKLPGGKNNELQYDENGRLKYQ